MKSGCESPHIQIADVACVGKVTGVSLILRLAPGDVMRSLSGIPLISIVYRCGVGSWHPPIPRPSAPRTIAINTPPLPLRNPGTCRWWRSWRTARSWANDEQALQSTQAYRGRQLATRERSILHAEHNKVKTPRRHVNLHESALRHVNWPHVNHVGLHGPSGLW